MGDSAIRMALVCIGFALITWAGMVDATIASTAPALLVGVNIGGLGTLIASMASLISVQATRRGAPELKGYCFLLFTGLNCAFLAALLALAVAIF